MKNITVWRIDKFAEKVGEGALLSTLSQFSVPLNKEVENFIRNKALQATKLKSSMSYVLVNEDIADVVAYFTILVKPFTINASCLSSTNCRLISRFSEENEESGNYTASVYLLAQIGKNYSVPKEYQISGKDLLSIAFEKFRVAQDVVGGKLVLIEREADRKKLHDFYKDNGFRSWNTRFDQKDQILYDQMIRVIESVA